MANELKQIRGQIRQIVKEMLPEILKAELQTAIYKQIAGELTAKLQITEGEIRRQLQAMDDRAKDVQSFIMREVVNNTQPRPSEQAVAEAPVIADVKQGE